VAFQKDFSGGFKAAVMRFNGTAWVYVGGQGTAGDEGFSAGTASYVSLARASNGTLYVAYQDLAADTGNRKASVMKLDSSGSGWVYVGTQVFSTGEAHDIALSLSVQGTPYVAYMDWNNGDKVSVVKAMNLVTLSSVGVTFNPSISGGTLPTLMLTCSPAANEINSGVWEVAEGASCQLGVTGGTAPSDYTMGAVTYNGTGVNADGTFIVPAGGISDLSATVALTRIPTTLVRLTSVGVTFNPSIAGGTLPTLTLTCSPAATVVVTNISWDAQEGASCQLGVTGGTAPSGYTMGAVMTYSGTGVNSADGTFTVPAGGIDNLSATVQLTSSSLIGLATLTRDLNVAFSPAISGGTSPTLTLACTPVATVLPEERGRWLAPLGASCRLGVTGGSAPPGYMMGAVTYSGTGVNSATGVFTVPAYGINNLGATMSLRPLSGSSTTPIPTLGVKALMLTLLMLLFGGVCGLRRNGFNAR
jgi:hypothetical protein